MRERVKAAFTTMGLSRTCARPSSLKCAISSSSSTTPSDRSALRGCDRPLKNQLLKEAAEAEDRRHVLKVNGSRENLLDIAACIRERSAP